MNSTEFNIRDERPGDARQVRQLHESAFSGDLEARIVKRLRDRGNVVASLVAVQALGPAKAEEKIVGHALFSPVTFPEAAKTVRAVGLGPLAVGPESQRQGIGHQLIREGLRRCAMAGFQAAVVLGHPAYYSRFGFRPASLFDLRDEYGGGDAFMALELEDGALREVSGLARYAPEFHEVISRGASPGRRRRSR